MTSKLFSARLTLLEASEGGRSSPVGSGYRSVCRFDGATDLYGVELAIPADLAPGETGDVEARVWAGESLPDLQVGHGIEVLEGHKVVARGALTSVPTRDIQQR
jgi:elongation factor Tu